MFVDCHLTCHGNFQHRLSTLIVMASPPQRILTIVPITTLTLPKKLDKFMDMMETVVT